MLEWADEIRRLGVRANADTPEDARKARELGAEGIGLCRTEHMFMAEDRQPKMRAMIMADDEDARRAALAELLPLQQEDFEGLFEAMAGLPVTIRLLDPPLHEFLRTCRTCARRSSARGSSAPTTSSSSSSTLDARARRSTRRTRCSARAAAGSGSCMPEIYEMQVEAIMRAATAVQERSGDAPHVEIMIPLVDYEQELEILRELVVRIGDEQGSARARTTRVGTMIELPRACFVADRIAKHADFFSFGTNDLTQTALGFSRDDVESQVRRRPTWSARSSTARRSRRSTSPASGWLVRLAAWVGREAQPGPEARHLRRARRRPRVDRLLPHGRAGLRVLLAVPRADRPRGGRAGGDRARG